MKYSIWIVTPTDYPYSTCFLEVANCLKDALMELMHEGEITYSRPEKNAIILGAGLLQELPPEDSIIFNLESVGVNKPWFTSEYEALLRRYKVWDFSFTNIEKLKALGIEAKYCGIGYSDALSVLPKLEKDIDVVFAGSLNERRLFVLEELSKSCKVAIIPPGIYGAKRDEYLARSKVCINLHYYEDKEFEIVRCSYLFANKKCVISEEGIDKALEAPFKRFLVPYEELVIKCLDTLEKGSYDALGLEGYELFKDMRQVNYLKEVL